MIQVRRLDNVRQLDTVSMLQLLEMGGEKGGRDIHLLFTTLLSLAFVFFSFFLNFFHFFHFLLGLLSVFSLFLFVFLLKALLPDSAVYGAALLACERLGSFKKVRENDLRLKQSQQSHEIEVTLRCKENICEC